MPSLRCAVLAISLSTAALAEEAKPAAPPADATPAGAAPEAAAPAVDPYQLVDEAENTTANLLAARAALDAQIAGGALTPRQICRAHAYRALIYLRLGDLERGDEKRMKQYELGTGAADAAIKADPSCPDGHYYRGATLGKWGETKGVLKALFLVGDIKAAFSKTIELQPTHLDARVALGQVDEAVPGLFGGSRERAEKAYREVLAKEPNHTRAMMELAELLRDDGKKEEALKLAKAVAEHTSPSRPWEWKKFDRARGAEMVAALAKK